MEDAGLFVELDNRLISVVIQGWNRNTARTPLRAIRTRDPRPSLISAPKLLNVPSISDHGILACRSKMASSLLTDLGVSRRIAGLPACLCRPFQPRQLER